MYTLRGRALAKLANLSAKPTPSTSASTPDAGLSKLCAICTPTRQTNGVPDGTASRAPLQAAPMSLRELEVLLALCQAGPSISDLPNAERLMRQLAPYVSESCCQTFVTSPKLSSIKSSPWATLTFTTADAVLRIGRRHSSLRKKAARAIDAYVSNCSKQSSVLMRTDIGEHIVDRHSEPSSATASVVALAASLIGFLETLTQNASFFTPQEQMSLVRSLQNILSDQYLLLLESTLSSIRTSRVASGFVKQWKDCMRHYAATGRPFGALALRKGLANFVEACAATLVLDGPGVQGKSVLESLMVQLQGKGRLHVRLDSELCQTFSSSASQELANVEAGSDYLRMESAWQRHLGYSVKASSLVAYLFCCIGNDQTADVDKLVTWLHDALADAMQATDPELASAVLRCMAVVSFTSVSKASEMSRAIQQFLISGSVPEVIASVAAESLLFVLKTLPQDVTITTLYSLGNSLSTSGGNREAAGHFALFNDEPMAATNGDTANHDVEKIDHERDQSPAASVMQSTDTFNSIIMAIVIITKGSEDETVTALAVSMLVQKVGKVNRAVDLKIITDAAILIADGGVAEFRSLLRLYQRLHQESVVTNDQLMLRAVSNI